MSWTWDDEKNRANKRRHGLTFETARIVFSDPLSLSQRDPYPLEERWQSMGMIGGVVVFVVHTWPETDDGVGRIISARKATAQERKVYEDGDF